MNHLGIETPLPSMSALDWIAILLLAVGFLFLSAATWLMPFLSRFFLRSRGSLMSHFASAEALMKMAEPPTLEILLPAHNEPESLPLSLTSIRACILKTKQSQVFSRIKIRVGLNGWTGPDAERASELADEVMNVQQIGKWWALCALVESSHADWVAFVDAGIIWPADLLTDLKFYFSRPEVLAINPRYTQIRSGVLQRAIWGLEAFLKRLENASGGPVSLHGATIFYRRAELLEVMRSMNDSLHGGLGGAAWLADDVAIPMALRARFRQSKIVYCSHLRVLDLFPASQSSERVRRQRILAGNFQWTRLIYQRLLMSGHPVAIVASRRVARLFWAWPVLLIAIGGLIMTLKRLHPFYDGLPPSILVGSTAMIILGAAACIMMMPSLKRLGEAFYVSLMSPFTYFSMRDVREFKWK